MAGRSIEVINAGQEANPVRAHGPREYHWAKIAVRAGWKRGRGRWLLARRSLSDPAEIAYYACYGPRRTSTADLAWTAGSRWHVEECIQQAKGEAQRNVHWNLQTVVQADRATQMTQNEHNMTILKQ